MFIRSLRRTKEGGAGPLGETARIVSMSRPASLPLLSVLSVLAFACLAPLATAQISPTARGPVDVTADQLEVQQHDCVAVWSGNAEALQDTSRLRADTLRIYSQSKPGNGASQPKLGIGSTGSTGGCGGLDRIEADGSVYYVTPSQVVKGDHAVYSAADSTIVVTGADVVAAQGKNVIAGQKLTINTKTGQATFDTNVRGRGQKGRVRAVIYPQGAGGVGGLAAPIPPPARRHPS
jgi:lipopolysaccharide export system protein LptA